MNSSSISLVSSLWVATSLVSSLPGSAMASPRVGPLTRAMIGPSCKPLDPLAFAGALTGRAAEGRQEAAGQLDARIGQGRRPRPGATPGNFETEPVTRYTASSKTSAGSRRAVACA